eukprot:1945616-Pyramimonas_sp.AAC.1
MGCASSTPLSTPLPTSAQGTAIHHRAIAAASAKWTPNQLARRVARRRRRRGAEGGTGGG